MAYVPIFLMVLLYLVITILIIMVVNNQLKNSRWIVRYFLQAMAYSLFFGVGLIPGGGDPGYDEPAPIPLAAWYATKNSFLTDVILPFFFWWAAIFLALVICRKIFDLLLFKKTH